MSGNKSALLFTILIALMLFSCGKDDTDPQDEGYLNGVFIHCEGTFNSNNGSISWYDPDSGLIINNLFQTVNGRPAGDVVQSFALAGDYGVIVANNSQKIEIVDVATFQSTRTITGFTYPRHFVYSGDGKGYLSNGNMQGHVYRIDLLSGDVTDTIETGFGPEQMLIAGEYLYVVNSGGFTTDNSVSVIDINSQAVVNTITVGDIPVALVSDVNNDIWVLCRGKVVYDESWTEIIEETDSRIVKIDSATGVVDREVVIGRKGDYFNPGWLAINPSGTVLYFGENEGLFSLAIDETSPSAEPLIDKHFSSAGINPVTGEIYALEITDYTRPGILHIYDGVNPVLSLETGVAPSGIVFTNLK